MNGIIFITGTDTGVGKTLLTAFLLQHLRGQGGDVLAMKPFCSGPRDDAELLHALQKSSLTLEETNPFYLTEPVAPWVGAKQGQQVSLKAALTKIKSIKNRCRGLLIEGSGGLLVPLGDGYMVSDLIAKLECPVIIVARNQLGTINHTLMTVKVMQSIGIKHITVVMMNGQKPDISAKTNPETLQKLLPNSRVFVLPYLGKRVATLAGIKRGQKKVKKTLAQILQPAIFTAFFPTSGRKG